MIRSMTGYGKSSRGIANFELEVEVKSLNNRFLEIITRLPKELSHKEFEIRNILKNNIQRGKVTLQINLKYLNNENSNFSVDENALENTVAFLNKLQNYSTSDEKIDLNHILSLQSFYISETTTFEDENFDEVQEVILEAVDCLNKMRSKEGQELRNDLQERANLILEKVGEIESLLKVEVNAYYNKLKDRVNQLITDLSQFDDRLNLELALLSEKYDTSEEIVRLRSHLKQFNQIITNGKEIGKKLNFLLQEMNREANTINSKSISTDISYKGLIIKEELEKIREQVQNIE